MPPKKRARLTPSTLTPDPRASLPPASTAASTPRPQSSTCKDPMTDPWTSTQETALYKLLIHHKPTGPHKHMHMLTIHNSLSSDGHTHTHARALNAESASASNRRASVHTKQSQSEGPKDLITLYEHMRIPALWTKLRELYDLDALDEREGQHLQMLEENDPAFNMSAPPLPTKTGPGTIKAKAKTGRRSAGRKASLPSSELGDGSEADGARFLPWREFELERVDEPEDELSGDGMNMTAEMWARRLKGSEDPESSPEPGLSVARGGNRGRGRGGRRGGIAAGGRRGSRATTATETTSSRGDNDEDSGGSGDEMDGGAESDEAEEEGETETPAKSTRRATARGGGNAASVRGKARKGKRKR